MYEYVPPDKVTELLEKAKAMKDVASRVRPEKENSLKAQGANQRLLEKYQISSKDIKIEVEIREIKRMPFYKLIVPSVGVGTKAFVADVKEKLMESFDLSNIDLYDSKIVDELKDEFTNQAGKAIASGLPEIDPTLKEYLALSLRNEVFDLGIIQMLLDDELIEEVVVNSGREPVRIYHKKYGWMETNVKIESEDDILNYVHKVGRRVGREITNLNPRLDAYLASGDRVNATLNPISLKGHTLTIRKFARDPWTATDFIKNGTVTSEVLSLIWLSVQHGMNMIISGGTGSGKTSFLNVCMAFIPPNQRIISIEDTKELQLPDFLYWCPMLTREANTEGRGEVSMLDLLINSLRMRPDRIILGEIRRQKEAEVLFEAMHTGHAVYSTLHADTCAQTIGRLTNPPINIPHPMLDSLHLNVVMFRDKIRRFRKVFELGEFVTSDSEREIRYEPSVLYRWDPRSGETNSLAENRNLSRKISLHTGLSDKGIESDLALKKRVLDWMVDNNIRKITDVGKVMNYYYTEIDTLEEAVEKNDPGRIFSEEEVVVKD